MDNYESPVEWCKRMQDDAKTGEEAMAYYELAKSGWRGRRNNEPH